MQLNHKTFGQGPPLIILHGLFGALDNWQTLGKRWAEDFTVLLVDQRNHGRSPHTDDIDYRLMAEDLKAFMEANWVYRAHILGHSMGGKTAMQFALLFGDMVDRLVVVDMAPKAYEGGHEPIFEALFALDVDQLQDRQDAEEFLAERIPDPSVRLFLMKNLSRRPEGGFKWKMNLDALYRNYQAILDNIGGGEPFDGPALFVRGERSDYVTDADWPAIQALFPNARLETAPAAGHWVHAETPDLLYDWVREFLLQSNAD